jgi:hypothetical protein
MMANGRIGEGGHFGVRHAYAYSRRVHVFRNNCYDRDGAASSFDCFADATAAMTAAAAVFTVL